MSPYTAILSSRFRTLLQYRAAAVAGVVTQLFFGLVRVMIFDAFYHSSTTPQPLSHAQATTYLWLGQAMLLLAMFGVDTDVAAMIRTGTVAYELTRPVDLYSLWFARAFSGRAAPLLMRAIPIFLLAGAFLGLAAPASLTAACLFAFSTFLSLLLCASMITLLTLSLLWTLSGEGITRLAPPFVFFFSGMIIPLPLFPDWLQPALSLLPFRALIDTPFRLYLGHLSGPPALLALAHQLLWTLTLITIGRYTLNRGLHRLVIQGG